MDGLRQEDVGQLSRQVRLLLLQSLPPPVLFDKRAQVVSHILRGMPPRK